MYITLIFLMIFDATSLEKKANHAIYISVAKIELNQEGNEVLISLKVFSDDLEDAIHNHSGKREKIVGREDISDLSSIIDEYINKKVVIYLDDNKVQLNVDSCQNIGDTTWIYLNGNTDSLMA